MSQITARYWREIPRRYRGEAAKSTKTGKVFFPARLVEPKNGNRQFEPTKLDYEGKLITYTVIRIAPAGFEDQGDYALGIIEMPSGARVTAQIADCPIDNVKIGMKVRIEFRKIFDDGHEGIHCYGYKVVPM